MIGQYHRAFFIRHLAGRDHQLRAGRRCEILFQLLIDPPDTVRYPGGGDAHQQPPFKEQVCALIDESFTRRRGISEARPADVALFSQGHLQRPGIVGEDQVLIDA
ncbi:hypothetical protein ES703_84877 [subsurface metagenome]